MGNALKTHKNLNNSEVVLCAHWLVPSCSFLGDVFPSLCSPLVISMTPQLVIIIKHFLCTYIVEYMQGVG